MILIKGILYKCSQFRVCFSSRVLVSFETFYRYLSYVFSNNSSNKQIQLTSQTYMLLACQFLQKTTVACRQMRSQNWIVCSKNECIEFSGFKFGIYLDQFKITIFNFQKFSIPAKFLIFELNCPVLGTLVTELF